MILLTRGAGRRARCSGPPTGSPATRDLLDSLTLNREVLAQTRALKDGADLAIDELERELLPDVAVRLGLTSSQLDGLIDERFPAIARARPQFDEILRRYEERVRIREAGIGIIPVAADYPLTAIGWWAVSLGALTSLAAGAALLGTGTRTARAA